MTLYNKILAMMASGCLLASCYEDLSTEATMSIPDILISSESDVLNVAYGHELTLEPTVEQEGRTDSDFSYLWEMDLTQGSAKNRIELGTGRSLTYRVSNSPSDKPYTLTLKVTDGQTGLYKMKSWSVYVSSSLGEGVLVAVTKDGGATCDLTLLASAAVTYGYASETPLVTSDLYSFANGAPIQGRINSMVTSVVTDGAVFNTSRVMIGTDEHIIAVDPVTYLEIERDASLFNSKETEFRTTMLFNFGDYCSGALINDRMFCCIGNFDRAYTKVPSSAKNPAFMHPNNTAYDKPDQGKILAFNPDDGKFHWASVLSVNSGMQSLSDLGITSSLDGATPLAGGTMKGSNMSMLLRLSDGSHHLYRMDLSVLNPQAEDITLKGLTDVSKAVSFAFCDNANVLYYASESKLYSVIITGGKGTVKALSWTPDDSKNEKITDIRQYAQSWYGTANNSFNDYPFVVDNHRTQLLITTYNESTGQSKVYMRPFSLSTGMFLLKDNGSFTVDGQIIAMCTTPR